MGNDDAVLELFVKALAAKRLTVTRALEDGRYLVDIAGTPATISLDNVRRDYARDHDPEAIVRFVDAIIQAICGELPPWSEAKSGLRLQAETAGQDWGDTLHEAVSDQFHRVLVYESPDRRTITWVTRGSLKEWGVSFEEVEAAASANMGALLKATPIELKKIEPYTLGLLVTPSVFKAALIFSPNLREVCEPVLGWPLLAVIPCRDFAFLFAASDDGIVERLGSTVVKEYRGSGYPITTEVLRIDDAGIEAIGEYPADG